MIKSITCFDHLNGLNDTYDHSESIDNYIGDTGATSLSAALKSNTTLTELDLAGEDKRKETQKTSISNTLFFSLIQQTP